MPTARIFSGWADRFFFSIRSKMLTAFLGLTLIPIMILGHLALKQMERALEEQIVEELQIEVMTAASALEDYLRGVGRDIGSLARFFQRRYRDDMTRVEWLQVRREFTSTIRAENAYYQIRFISSDGMELLRINNNKRSLVQVSDDELQNKSDRYYVQEALKLEQGEIYLSYLDFNVEHGQIEQPLRLVVRLATPIVDSEESPAGIIVINVFGEELLASLEDLLAVDGMRVLLLNQGGRFIEMESRDGRPHFISASADQLGTFVPMADVLPLSDGQAQVISAGSDLIAIAPVQTDFQRTWYLIKIYPQKQIYAKLNQLKLTFRISAVILACLATVLAILAARRFSRPIRTLSKFAEDISDGDLSRRVTIRSRDELGQLSESLNAMAKARKEARQMLLDWNDSLQLEVERKVLDLERTRSEAEQVRERMNLLEKQLLQADRLASLGLLSATVAHEIGNPLAGLKVRLQMIQRMPDLKQTLVNDVEKMLSMVDRLSHILGHLTNYVSPESSNEREQVDVNQVLGELAFILGEEAGKRGIDLRFHPAEAGLTICSTAQYLHQILMNLILNALQACDTDGCVEVSCVRQEGQVIISVKDNGRGLPAGESERLFEPLVTSREDGTGLGLAIVSQLVSELKGTIQLHERESGGVAAVLSFSDGETGCREEF